MHTSSAGEDPKQTLKSYFSKERRPIKARLQNYGDQSTQLTLLNWAENKSKVVTLACPPNALFKNPDDSEMIRGDFMALKGKLVTIAWNNLNNATDHFLSLEEFKEAHKEELGPRGNVSQEIAVRQSLGENVLNRFFRENPNNSFQCFFVNAGENPYLLKTNPEDPNTYHVLPFDRHLKEIFKKPNGDPLDSLYLGDMRSQKIEIKLENQSGIPFYSLQLANQEKQENMDIDEMNTNRPDLIPSLVAAKQNRIYFSDIPPEYLEMYKGSEFVKDGELSSSGLMTSLFADADLSILSQHSSSSQIEEINEESLPAEFPENHWLRALAKGKNTFVKISYEGDKNNLGMNDKVNVSFIPPESRQSDERVFETSVEELIRLGHTGGGGQLGETADLPLTPTDVASLDGRRVRMSVQFDQDDMPSLTIDSQHQGHGNSRV